LDETTQVQTFLSQQGTSESFDPCDVIEGRSILASCCFHCVQWGRPHCSLRRREAVPRLLQRCLQNCHPFRRTKARMLILNEVIEVEGHCNSPIESRSCSLFSESEKCQLLHLNDGHSELLQQTKQGNSMKEPWFPALLGALSIPQVPARTHKYNMIEVQKSR
jgi:hypothetical protein